MEDKFWKLCSIVWFRTVVNPMKEMYQIQYISKLHRNYGMETMVLRAYVFDFSCISKFYQET